MKKIKFRMPDNNFRFDFCRGYFKQELSILKNKQALTKCTTGKAFVIFRPGSIPDFKKLVYNNLHQLRYRNGFSLIRLYFLLCVL